MFLHDELLTAFTYEYPVSVVLTYGGQQQSFTLKPNPRGHQSFVHLVSIF